MACCEVLYCDYCYLKGTKKATDKPRVHMFSKCVHCTFELYFYLSWLVVQIGSYIFMYLVPERGSKN